jgi:AcrR family transcriptional regulator
MGGDKSLQDWDRIGLTEGKREEDSQFTNLYDLFEIDFSIWFSMGMTKTASEASLAAAPYSAHRERQRRRILSAAQSLFDARGIDRVTVAEIVAETGIRASTLYEYFANKDEIVWALVEESMAASGAHAQRYFKEARGLAIDKIAALFRAFEDELVQEPARVRFMAQFDAMYAREWTVERLMAVEERIFPGSFKELSSLIRKGIKDGSLRADLDPKVTMHAVMNVMVATQRRLASLGSRVEEEYGQPVDVMFRESVRILLRGLAA